MTNVSLQRVIDKYVGGALCLSYAGLNLLKGSDLPEKKFVKNILVVRLWTLGETLLTLPMIKKLREEYPHAKITVLARNRNKGVLERCDFIDEILLFERENLRKLLRLRGKFDIAIDTEPYLRISGVLSRFLGRRSIGFSHSVRGLIYSKKVRYDDDLHCAQIMCDLLKPLDVKYTPEKLARLNFDGDSQAKLEKIIGRDLADTKIIGMHPSTAESATYRAWPKKSFAELIKLLSDRGYHIVLTGTKGEHKFNEDIIKMCGNSTVFNLAGLLNFDEFIGLFDHLDLYISNDTGPMHLSAAQGCKTIGLFGPNLSERFGPYPLDNKQNFALYHGDKLPCSPCISVYRGRFKKCRRLKDGTGECMTLIKPEEVAVLVEEVIG